MSRFKQVEFDREIGSQINFEIQINSLVAQEEAFSFGAVERPVMQVR